VFFLYGTYSISSTEPSTTLISQVGHKFPEVFRLRQGSYGDLPSAKISELMKSTSLDVNSHILFIIFQFLQIIHIFLVLCIIDLFQHLLLQNAPTQSLLSVVNGILEESVERRNGEIPHVWHWRL